MKEMVLKYCNEGYNCSQCILKAFGDKYGIEISKQSNDLCCCLCTGYGVGSICNALMAGGMIFGLLYDELTAKSLRMKLTYEFQETYGNINCAMLRKGKLEEDNCAGILAEIAGMIERIINQFGSTSMAEPQGEQELS